MYKNILVNGVFSATVRQFTQQIHLDFIPDMLEVTRVHSICSLGVDEDLDPINTFAVHSTIMNDPLTSLIVTEGVQTHLHNDIFTIDRRIAGGFTFRLVNANEAEVDQFTGPNTIVEITLNLRFSANL